MKEIKIYRKRLIPDECVLLKDDVVLEANEDVIVTKWHTLKPRRDFDHGYSCYYLKLGYKVSKFYRADNTLLYWYCDVVDYKFEEGGNVVIAEDLLVDVVVYPDGFVKVLDLEELAIAIEKGICEPEQVGGALRKLDKLLSVIYEDKFEVLCDLVNRWSDSSPC
jgi:predicted RNA-binding protein associated with RNAse of E/G family